MQQWQCLTVLEPGCRTPPLQQASDLPILCWYQVYLVWRQRKGSRTPFIPLPCSGMHSLSYCCTHTAGTWELLITGLKLVPPAALLDVRVKKTLLARHFIKRMKWMLNGIGGENSRQEARRFHGKLKVTAEMHRTDTETITLSVTDLLLQPPPFFFLT